MKRLNFLIAASALLASTAALDASARSDIGFGITFGGPGPYYGYYGGPVYYGPRYVYPRYAYPVYGPPVYYYAYPPPPPRVVYVERYVERVPAPPPRIVERREVPPPQPSRAAIPPQRLEKMTLSATELFEFDRATLRSPQPRLDEIARALNENPQIGNVRITGYTDRLGTDAYNQKLSQRRADAVKSYLVGKGVAANRLNAVGKGEGDPVVHCNQKDQPALIKCLEPNRRVEVEQITVEKKVPAERRPIG
jgi:outer membrane protein OmpA-like peptidoglycan-associated protein